MHREAKAVQKLIAKLKPQLIVAGLNDSSIHAFKIEGKTIEELLNYMEAVTNLTLRGGAYYGFMSIYGLKPPEWWVNMANLGETDLREHKLLSKEAKKLRHAWRELHHAKAKSSIAESHPVEGNSETVSLRPES